MYEPEYKLKCGMTTAMLLACNKIISPKEFYHDPKLLFNDYYTVGTILTLNNIKVP